MSDGLLINSSVCLEESSLHVWLILLCLFEVTYWFTRVPTRAWVCVRCIGSVQSFLVYLREVQMVFKEREASSESGPWMWDWLSHIDSVVFECVWVCVCVFLSHGCAWPFPPDTFKVASIYQCLWTFCPSSFYSLTQVLLVTSYFYVHASLRHSQWLASISSFRIISMSINYFT